MTVKRPTALCPLCGNNEIRVYHKDRAREYLQCSFCELVFVPERYWLSAESERAVYDLHENDPSDSGYRKFLSRMTAPLLKKIEPGQIGLDFGCGSGPVLSQIMKEHGHPVDLFDPFYFNDPAVFHKKYDFICATEVVEHLRDPEKEFENLFTMLNPGGWLGIMTKRVIDQQAFRQWHYIRDMTHICFYSEHTFEYLAHRFCAASDFVANDVVLFNRSR